jgi:hypothetical protein
MVNMSTLSSSTRTRSLPRLCAASVCTSNGPAAAARAAVAMSAMGCSVPTSLLLCMMVTSTVLGVTAACAVRRAK